jgi:hypothetical protein
MQIKKNKKTKYIYILFMIFMSLLTSTLALRINIPYIINNTKTLQIFP